MRGQKNETEGGRDETKALRCSQGESDRESIESGSSFQCIADRSKEKFLVRFPFMLKFIWRCESMVDCPLRLEIIGIVIINQAVA